MFTRRDLTPAARATAHAVVAIATIAAMFGSVVAHVVAQDAARHVVVGVNDDYPPFEFVDAAGGPTGFDVDLVRAAAAAADLPIELRSAPWAELRRAFAAGEIQALAGMIRTRARDAVADFSDSYLTTDYVAVTRPSRTPPETVTGLAGLMLVVERDSVAYEWAVEHGLADRVRTVESEPEAVRVLAGGTGDVALVARRTERSSGADLDLRAGGESIFHAFLCIAVAEGDGDLKDAFDGGLAAVRASGRYEEIYDRWLAPPPAKVLGLPVHVVLWTSGIAALVLLAILIWSAAEKRRLRSERDLADRRFLQMFDESPIPSAILGDDRRLHRANAAFARLVDRSPDELVGGGIEQVVHPDDLAAEGERIAAMFAAGGGAYAAELRLVRPDDSARWCRLSVLALADHRRSRRALGMFEDVTERRAAEHRLRESEAVYRSLIEDQTEFVVRWRPDGTREFVNEAYCHYFGLTREQVIGSSFFPHIGDEDAARVRARLASLTPELPVSSDEYRVTRGDGVVRWQRWTDRARFDAQGNLLEVLSVGRDVTERREAEDALERSEHHYRALIENAHDLITVVDAAGTILYQSPAAERVIGRHPEERIGGSIGDLLHGDDRPGVMAALAEGFGDPGRTVAFTHRLRHADGSWRWIESVGRVFRSDDGEVRGVVNSRDVTDRERVAGRLRDSEARFRLAIEASLDAFVLMRAERDDAGRVTDFVFVDVNERWCALFGRERDAFVGQRLCHAIPTAREHGFVDACRNVCETGEPFVEEFRVHLEDVKAAWLRHQIVRVEDGVAVTTRDVTAERRAEAERGTLETQLRHAQKMEAVGVLAGGVAHDFNNLLTVIGGYVDILRTDPEPPRRDRALEAISDAHARAVNLTRQLLTFGRKQVTQPQPLHVGHHVTGLLRMLARLVGESISIDLDLTADEWWVRADGAQIDQVVVNLAANARDAMPRGGQIRITTRNVVVPTRRGEGAEAVEPGEYVELTVADDGEGMREETRSRVFEPFFTTKADRGTGLGLASVYGIVRAAEGRIEVESAPGAGTIFRVVLPRTRGPSPAELDTEPLPSPADLAGSAVERLLVVDDEDILRDLLAEVLRDQGFDVETAPDAETALGVARAGPRFDVLVTDLVMPGMGGRELGRILRAEQPDLVVLHVSGYAEDALSDPPPNRELLTKPFSPQTLCDRIRRLLAERG